MKPFQSASRPVSRFPKVEVKPLTRKFISRSRAPLPVMEAGPPFGMEKSSTTERKNTAALSSKNR